MVQWHHENSEQVGGASERWTLKSRSRWTKGDARTEQRQRRASLRKDIHLSRWVHKGAPLGNDPHSGVKKVSAKGEKTNLHPLSFSCVFKRYPCSLLRYAVCRGYFSMVLLLWLYCYGVSRLSVWCASRSAACSGIPRRSTSRFRTICCISVLSRHQFEPGALADHLSWAAPFSFLSEHRLEPVARADHC